MSLDPRLRKFLRFGLIGCGAATIMSGVVGILNTWQLVDASVEQEIGVSRLDLASTYIVMLLFGVAMVYVGLRWKK